jgi:protein-tyrosine phosphatase
MGQGLRLSRRGRWIALSVALALSAGTAVWAYPPLGRLVGISRAPDNWTEVRPGWLYRSGRIAPGAVADVLRDKRIDVVLDLTDETKDDDARAAERAAAESLGIRYFNFPVAQSRSVALSSFARAVAEIERARQRGDRVLVHCRYGHRRSAAAIALYARLIEHEPPHVAYTELVRYAGPDSHWSDDVRSYLERHLAEVRTLVASELGTPLPEPIAD